MHLPAIHSTTLIALASFASISALVWLALDLVAARRRKPEDRLRRFQVDPAGVDTEGLSKTPGAVTEWLNKAAPQLAQPLQPKTEQDAGKLKLRLAQAGFRSDMAVTMYLGLKSVTCLLALAISGGWLLLSGPPAVPDLTRALLVVLVTFLVPDVVLMFLTSRRKLSLFLSLPDALDLLVISVEAGLGLDQAMQKVSVELTKAHPLLAREFAIANSQLHMGMTRVQVLRELAQRNGEKDLETLASVLIQACKFGSGVGMALRTQSDAMRIRRRQMAEEKAAKCAVKLIFPLVLFIFPGIFVVLVGPAAISIIRNFLPLAGNT